MHGNPFIQCSLVDFSLILFSCHPALSRLIPSDLATFIGFAATKFNTSTLYISKYNHLVIYGV
jgi:hypothetical protein